MASSVIKFPSKLLNSYGTLDVDVIQRAREQPFGITFLQIPIRQKISQVGVPGAHIYFLSIPARM